MALLDGEVQRIRNELGYNVMGLQALPYIGITALFDSVIQSYLTAGAKTTSATAVAASTVAAPATLTLTSGTGFAAGARIVIDVDARQEMATIQDMPSATEATVLLTKVHSGTYPVTVEGGESMVREHLEQLRLINGPGGTLERMRSSVGLKRVDEVEFYGGSAGAGSSGKSAMEQVMQLIEWHRDQLAAALGVERLNRRGGGGGCELY